MYLEALEQMEKERDEMEKNGEMDSPGWINIITLIEGYYRCKTDIEEHENRQVYLSISSTEKDYFMMEAAVAKLIGEDILFVCCGDTGFKRTEMMVNCNDLFAWACSDAEPLPAYDIEKLYKAWKEDEHWGISKWCAIHRNQKPQAPIVIDMKKDGAWSDEMEALPDNLGLEGWIENYKKEEE